jgi:hypothetical protein
MKDNAYNFYVTEAAGVMGNGFRSIVKPISHGRGKQ